MGDLSFTPDPEGLPEIHAAVRKTARVDLVLRLIELELVAFNGNVIKQLDREIERRVFTAQQL